MLRRTLAALAAMTLAACAANDLRGPERTGPDAGAEDTSRGVIDVGADVGAGTDAGGDPDASAGDAGADVAADVAPGEDTGGGDAGGGDVGADAGFEDTAPDAGTDAAPDATPDTGPDATSDVGVDVPEPCDLDGDGVPGASCGGMDCDDTDARVGPFAEEGCNFVDDDCDGVVNNGIVCQVYAHTSSTLYLVDPFLGTRTSLGSVPGLFDFDTAPDGALYGISSSALFRYDDVGATWDRIGSLSTTGTANGFAIDSRGTAYATAGNNVYEVDLLTGATSLIGGMGSGFVSSGDCVVNKDDTLYMTSNHSSGGDTLIRIDADTGVGTAIGNTGFGSIYGLTAAWGTLFGFTGSGDVISIDAATGAGRRLHGFSGASWYGAASSTTR